MFRLLALLISAAAVATAAASNPTFLLDNLMSSSQSSVKAKTSSEYYDYAKTEVACTSQINYKNCRFTGCPVYRNIQMCPSGVGNCRVCQPDSIYFQTDHTCCSKEHSYSYGDRQRDVGVVGFIDKVGTCDWEISMYRTFLDDNNDVMDTWTPHLTDDGTALKWGTAWGTCYLNAEAEHCDSPLCERMALSIQGGLYATLAYSTERSTYWEASLAPRLDTCNGELPDFIPLRQARAKQTPATSQAPATKAPAAGAKGGAPAGKQDANAKAEGPSMPDLINLALDYIWWYSCDVLGTCGKGITRPPSSGVATRQPAGPVKAELSYDHDHTAEVYYPGMALVLSGPMYVQSKNGAKVEETGMYEFTLAFEGDGSTVSEPVNRWPVVRARGTKLRFTREEEHYYQGGSQ